MTVSILLIIIIFQNVLPAKINNEEGIICLSDVVLLQHYCNSRDSIMIK